MRISRFRPGVLSMRSGFWALVTSLSAVGCAPVPNPHTIAEYRANAALLASELARCVNDPGTLQSTPDCTNARVAERLESMGQLRLLPSLPVPRK